MAALRVPSASFLSAFLPVARAQLYPGEASSIQRLPLLQRFRLNASILPAVLAPIPSLLGELWDGLLKAVPKKKTSHMKKRHRQMAGKALKDVTAINTCSSCGRPKRAHILCPYCVKSVKQWLNNNFTTARQLEEKREKKFAELNATRKEKGKQPMKWSTMFNSKRVAGGEY